MEDSLVNESFPSMTLSLDDTSIPKELTQYSKQAFSSIQIFASIVLVSFNAV